MEWIGTKFPAEELLPPLLQAQPGTFEITGSTAILGGPLMTSEVAYVYDEAFDELEIFNIDFTENPWNVEQLYKLRTDGTNYIYSMVTDGRFLYLNFVGSTIRQWAWDGSNYYEVSRVTTSSPTDTRKNMWFVPGNGNYLFALETYNASSDMIVGLRPPETAPYLWPHISGFLTSNTTEWTFAYDFRWRVPAATASWGDLWATTYGSYLGTNDVLSITGITADSYDQIQVETLGSSGVGRNRGSEGHDRDTGKIIMFSPGAATNETHLYEVDLTLPQGAPITRAWRTQSLFESPHEDVVLGGMSNGFALAVIDVGTAKLMRSYTIGAATLTQQDEYDVTGMVTTIGFGDHFFTSPYTNKLYLMGDNVDVFSVNDSGSFQYHGDMGGVSTGGEITVYPTWPPEQHIDPSTVWDGMVGFWEFDENVSYWDRPSAPTLYDAYGGSNGPLEEHDPNAWSGHFCAYEWLRWSWYTTANTGDPIISVGDLTISLVGHTGGAWPGCLTWFDFGESDGFIEGYMTANNTNDQCGIVIRLQDTDNFIYTYIDPGNELLVLAKVEDGTETTLDEATVSGMETSQRLRIRFNGSQIDVAMFSYSPDFWTYLSATTTFLQTATKHGNYLRGLNGGTPDISWFSFTPWPEYFDQFGADPRWAPGTRNLVYSDDEALWLDENDEYVSLTTTGGIFDSTGSFTMTFFINPTVAFSSGKNTLMVKGDPTASGTTSIDWMIYQEQVGTADSLHFAIVVGGTLHTLTFDGNDVFELGTDWRFIAVFYDAASNTIGLTVDTIAQKRQRTDPMWLDQYDQGWITKNVSGTRSNAYSTLLLGSRTNGSIATERYQGLIDKFVIWNRVLTFDELLWMHNKAFVNNVGRTVWDLPQLPSPLPSIKTYLATDSAGATGTSLDIVKPNGISSGDLLIVMGGSDDAGTGASLSTTETGFTKIGEFGDGNGAHVAAWWKVANGTETDFTMDSSASVELIGYYIVIENQGSSSILDFAGTTGNSASPQIYDATWTDDINVTDTFMALSLIVTDGSDVITGETTGPTDWTKITSTAPENSGNDCGGYLSMLNGITLAEPKDDSFTSSVTDGYATIVVAIKANV